MVRKRPPFTLQKWVQWLPIVVALIAIFGFAALFSAADQALARQEQQTVASVALANAKVVVPPVDLPPAAIARDQEISTAVRSVPASQSVQSEQSSSYVYTVRMGEYWIGIANRFGISYTDLRTANPDLWSLRHEIIRPGDQMVIPGISVEEVPPPVHYVVQPGDSWYRIANSFGVPFWDLRLDNLQLWRQRGIYIRPGDELLVKEQIEAVMSGHATTQVATAASVAPSSPQSATGNVTTLPESSAGAPILVDSVPADTTVYTVRPGDTWFSIAAAHGLSFDSLRNANPMLWSARGQAIRPADQMIIPSHGTPPPPPEIRSAPEEEAPAPEQLKEMDDKDGEEPTNGGAGTPPDAEAPVASVEQSTPALTHITLGPIQAMPNNGTRLQIAFPEPDLIYLVQLGEDWLAVAESAGVTVDELKAVNPILASRELQERDAILFP